MLRSLEPVLTQFDPSRMVDQARTAPFHPGAERYFRERGWVN
jgi:uncharacterized protein